MRSSPTKTALPLPAGQIRPFPPGIAGHLALQDFHVRIAGAAAVAAYVIDEQEVFYAHELHCRYRNTDTWLSSAGEWRLLASQALAQRAPDGHITGFAERREAWDLVWSRLP